MTTLCACAWGQLLGMRQRPSTVRQMVAVMALKKNDFDVGSAVMHLSGRSSEQRMEMPTQVRGGQRPCLGLGSWPWNRWRPLVNRSG